MQLPRTSTHYDGEKEGKKVRLIKTFILRLISEMREEQNTKHECTKNVYSHSNAYRESDPISCLF